MAKSSAIPVPPKPEAEMFDKGSAGMKRCPRCEKYFKGPTRTTCPGCGYQFPPKEVKQKQKGKAPQLDGFAVVQATFDFAKQQGGVEKAKAILNQVAELVKATGGIPQAVVALDKLEQIHSLNT